MPNKPAWCYPPNGEDYGFPKIYDSKKYPNFFEWIVKQGYPQDVIDSYEGQFYCSWKDIEDEDIKTGIRKGSR